MLISAEMNAVEETWDILEVYNFIRCINLCLNDNVRQNKEVLGQTQCTDLLSNRKIPLQARTESFSLKIFIKSNLWWLSHSIILTIILVCDKKDTFSFVSLAILLSVLLISVWDTYYCTCVVFVSCNLFSSWLSYFSMLH